MKNILKVELINKTNHKTFFCNENQKPFRKTIEQCPALFLDRDGVLIKDCHYIRDPKDVIILEGVSSLLAKFNSLSWRIVVISNQSGISRGFFSWKDYEKVNLEMNRLISKNSKIDAIYASGDSPSELNNTWRKPNPNMLLEAKKDLNINLTKSIIIGDRMTDLIAGQKAGLRLLIHVLTGHGKKERLQILEHYSLSKPTRIDKPFIREIENGHQKILFINNLFEIDQNILFSSQFNNIK